MRNINKILRGLIPLLIFTVLLSGMPWYQTEAYNSNAEREQNNNQMQYQLQNGLHNLNLNMSRLQYKNASKQDLQTLVGLLTQLRDRLRLMTQLRDQTYSSSDLQVATRYATDLSGDEALLRGHVVDFGDSDFADVWFVYGTSTPDFDNTTVVERIEDSEDGYFEQRVAGLDENTIYYYRAIGEDEDENIDYGSIIQFQTNDSDGTDSDGNEPDTVTRNAASITDDSALLRGTVDMNDFENGEVFFVYGEDEDKIDDVSDDFNTYGDVDEDGVNLQKVLVDNDLDAYDSYEEEVQDLDNDTDHYFSICVDYEDDDGEDVLLCGDTRSFTTDF